MPFRDRVTTSPSSSSNQNPPSLTPIARLFTLPYSSFYSHGRRLGYCDQNRQQNRRRLQPARNSRARESSLEQSPAHGGDRSYREEICHWKCSKRSCIIICFVLLSSCPPPPLTARTSCSNPLPSSSSRHFRSPTSTLGQQQSSVRRTTTDQSRSIG